MRRIKLTLLEPGMKIARPVYAGDGRLLLASGLTLTEKFIERLAALGIGSLYIEDVLFPGKLNVRDVVSEKTRSESILLVKECFRNLEKEKNINTWAVRQTVNELADEIFSNRDILINYFDIRTYDDYTFDHSVNVTILSVLAGISLGYNRLDLRELATGALLHDIGKVSVDKKILNKKGKLTPEEFKQIQQHSLAGFEKLRSYYEITTLSSTISYQHHERIDGSGYPRGLKGEEIHEYARIVMVADVFDALTSDRPYRSAYTITEAFGIVKELEPTFDSKSITAVLSNISPYPIGSIVMLNTGQIGQVVDTHKKDPAKPIVRIYFDRDLKYMEFPYEIDIYKSEFDLYIEKSLNDEEIAKLNDEAKFLIRA
jgi:putative nucleotidyltransferase with HDIG domain